MQTMGRGSTNLTAFLFVAPAVVLCAVFSIFPTAQALDIALFRWRGLSMDREFVGAKTSAGS